MKSPLIVALFICQIIYANGELFTSLGHLVSLVESIDGVSRELDAFMRDELKIVAEAYRKTEDFRDIAMRAASDPERFVGNPVNAFLLIRKLAIELQEFVDHLVNTKRLEDLVQQIREKFVLPTNEDYEGTATGIQRLQDTYRLKPRDLQKGTLSNNHRSRPLTAFECFELGRIAYENKNFYHTVNWMMETLEQLKIEGTNATVDKVLVLDYLSYATAQQGNTKHAFDLTKQILEIQPKHERAISNLAYFEDKLKSELKKLSGDRGGSDSSVNDPFEFKNPRPPPPYPEYELYEALCRGDVPPLDPKREKNLKCRYIHYHPLLYIAPIKEEQVFDEPALWLYHDVITDKQIRLFKSLATPKLKRAIVRSPITGQFETADYRVSKSAWLQDADDPSIGNLTRLVEAITNLSMSTAEEWQVANYGIGGQYEPHFDFARKTDPANAFESSVGNRVATWLFYLEAPEVGGATVFPPVKTGIRPLRGSAAFWYNLLPSGDGDYLTRHAACPVLFGVKWVSNKWIHIRGQEFKRPCGLVRDISAEMNL